MKHPKYFTRTALGLTIALVISGCSDNGFLVEESDSAVIPVSGAPGDLPTWVVSKQSELDSHHEAIAPIQEAVRREGTVLELSQTEVLAPVVPAGFTSVSVAVGSENHVDQLSLPTHGLPGAVIEFESTADHATRIATPNFELPVDGITLEPGEKIAFIYDATWRRWRISDRAWQLTNRLEDGQIQPPEESLLNLVSVNNQGTDQVQLPDMTDQSGTSFIRVMANAASSVTVTGALRGDIEVAAASIAYLMWDGSAWQEITWAEDSQTAIALWREALLESAEAALIAEYPGQFPTEAYDWIKRHGFREDLLMGVGSESVVLSNVAQLLSELDAKVADDMANLVFSSAATRRGVGLDPINLLSNGSYIWTYEPGGESAVVVERRRQYMVIAPDMDQWLRSKGYTNEQALEALDETLAAMQESITRHGLDKIGAASVTDAGYALYYVSVLNGVTKAERDDFPRASETIKHMHAIQSRTSEPFVDIMGHNISWPKSSKATNAHWSLLTSVTAGRPTSEMEYVWSRFSDTSLEVWPRLRNYGHYRGGPDLAPFVATSTFPERSIAWMEHVGGVCGTMSVVARGFYVSLGMPAMHTSQPGHAAVTRYVQMPEETHGTLWDHLMIQSLSPVAGSTSEWMFGEMGEDSSYRIAMSGRQAGNEYHLGLVLANNFDADGWVLSRALVREAMDAVDLEQRWALLMRAVSASPFNAEAWHQLSTAKGFDGDAVLEINEVLESKLDGMADRMAATDLGGLTLSDAQIQARTIKFGQMITSYRDSIVATMLNQSSTVAATSADPAVFNRELIKLDATNQYDLSPLLKTSSDARAASQPAPIVLLLDSDKGVAIDTPAFDQSLGEYPGVDLTDEMIGNDTP